VGIKSVVNLRLSFDINADFWRAQQLQLRVLRLGLLQDGVGIGIFPELEEILVSGEKSFERTLCSFAQY